MALASLGLIYFLFRRRAEGIGFPAREVALLTLGSIAGWAVNVPLAVYGGTYLMVNVGGALVPLILVGIWIRQRKLPLHWLVLGTALVAYAAWRIVRFDPATGIIAEYPDFFLPVAVALAFALLVSFRKPVQGAALAYACGTLGALIGADLLHVGDIAAHFRAAPENTLISIGGAGVFDMVFLAGAFAMALHLVVVLLATRKRAPAPPPQDTYPLAPLTLRDSRRVHESFLKLDAPNGLERALAGLALSNLALKEGQYDRSVRMGWLAVESLLATPSIGAYMQNGVPAALKQDVALLQARAKEPGATLRDAGEANTAAKILVAALAPKTQLPHALEGVA